MKPLSICWSSSTYAMSDLGQGWAPIIAERFCLDFAVFPPLELMGMPLAASF
jgi:hypothetical protein